jgi:hypothetical protein
MLARSLIHHIHDTSFNYSSVQYSRYKQGFASVHQKVSPRPLRKRSVDMPSKQADFLLAHDAASCQSMALFHRLEGDLDHHACVSPG